jgi:hypothetical protein
MSLNKPQDDVKKAIDRALGDFLHSEVTGESNAEKEQALLDSILKAVRARQGVGCDPEEWVKVDAATIKAILNSDTDDPALVIAEKALRRMATDQSGGGVTLIEDDIERRKKAISTKQSKVASKPRRKNPIAIRIEEIVAGTPKISKNSLMHTLKKEVGGDVIESETDDEFMPRDRKFRGIKKSGLRNHLLRAKK